MADSGSTTRKVVLFSVFAGLVAGVVGVASTTWMIGATSTTAFCGTACHSMTWVHEAYERGPHSRTASGVTAGCADCHIPYESQAHVNPLQYVVLMTHKATAGIKDVYHEMLGTISTKEKWEKRRLALSETYKGWMKDNGSITCRGCHDLEAFGGKEGEMRTTIHADVIKSAKPDCLQCHEGVGHVYQTAEKAAEPPKVEAPATPAEPAKAEEPAKPAAPAKTSDLGAVNLADRT